MVQHLHVIIPCGHLEEGNQNQKVWPVSNVMPKALFPIEGHTILAYVLHQIHGYAPQLDKTFHLLFDSRALSFGQAMLREEFQFIVERLHLPYQSPKIPNFDGDIAGAIDGIVLKTAPNDDALFLYHPDDVVILTPEPGPPVFQNSYFLPGRFKPAIDVLRDNTVALFAASQNLMHEGIVTQDPSNRDTGSGFRVHDFTEHSPFQTFGDHLFNLGILMFNVAAWKRLSNCIKELGTTGLPDGTRAEPGRLSLFKAVGAIHEYKSLTTRRYSHNDDTADDRIERANTFSNHIRGNEVELLGHRIDNSWFHFDTYSQAHLYPKRYYDQWCPVRERLESRLDEPPLERIFVSHSSKNKAFAVTVVQWLKMLKLFGGTPLGEYVYFSSSPELNPTGLGADYRTEMRHWLARSTLVIFILTPQFFESSTCLIEMGAAWAVGCRTIVVKGPGFNKSLLQKSIMDRFELCAGFFSDADKRYFKKELRSLFGKH